MVIKQELIGIVCHDAGGAEIVSSFVLQKNIKVEYCLEGPAIEIFERKFGSIKNNSLSDIVNKVDWFLCGTSWKSSLEINAIVEAKKKGKKVVSFIEHWVNYSARFNCDGVKILPDEIWVGDIYAKKIAEKSFPGLQIKLIDNPYLLEVKESLKKLKPSKELIKKRIALYLCENTSDHMLLQHGDANYLGYNEHDALQFFLDNVDKVDRDIDTIVIRLHPSEYESKEKYTWAKNHPINVSCNILFSEEKNLMQDIVDCVIVIGAETMAMVVGIIAGKRVISSIPEEGRKCVLPFSEIEHMLKIVSVDLNQ